MREYEQGMIGQGQSGCSSAVRCYKCGSYGHMARECLRDLTCFKCGQVGHIRTECPKLERTSSRGRKSEQVLSAPTDYVEQPTDEVAEAVSQSQVRQVDWSPNQALTMTVPVWIGRRKLMATVDTAAQVTVLKRSVSIELGCEAPVKEVQLRNAQTDPGICVRA